MTINLFCLQVNSQSLLGCGHQEAVQALRRAAGGQLVLSICDGFDASALDNQSSSLNRNSVRYNSLSSIDRDSNEVSKILFLSEVSRKIRYCNTIWCLSK